MNIEFTVLGVCLPGYTKAYGTGNCVPCPPGTYKNITGNQPCQNCSTGMYGTMEGETDDSKCVNCMGTVVENLSGGIECGMSSLTKAEVLKISCLFDNL